MTDRIAHALDLWQLARKMLLRYGQTPCGLQDVEIAASPMYSPTRCRGY